MDGFGVLEDGGSCLVDVESSLRSTFGLGRALVSECCQDYLSNRSKSMRGATGKALYP